MLKGVCGEIMTTSERRKSRRLRVNLPVAYQRFGQEKEFGETVAKDISITGMRINAACFIAPGTDLLVKLRFPEVNRIVEAVARIAWSQRISFSDQYQAGLRFTQISSVFRRWLEEYILINEALGS
ncbi:MAG: PilZ domain-containing protein [Deltaproteobacteria bacterium]